MDADTNDITSNGFGNTLTRDGQGSASANLPMNNFRHTGVGNAAARTDYAALGQLQDGIALNWTIGTGTGDAISASYTPALTALSDGQLCFVRSPGANATTTPTFSPSGLTARTITRVGGGALVVGDIPANLSELILRYNLANTRWELLNPTSIVRWAVAGGTADAITASFSPPIPVLFDGALCFFRATATNATTTPTFAPDGLSAHVITKQGGAALVAGNISAAGAEYILRYNLASTRWELLNPTVSSAVPPAGSFKNLSIKVASGTTVTVAADAVVTTDSINFQTTALSGTINLGTSGAANALDTGTIAIDTWYAIWTIAKADGTTAGLASTSFTAPTMPTGYTFKARIGAVRTVHATATLLTSWQLGRIAQYIVGTSGTLHRLAAGNVGSTLTAVSTSALVPPTASRIFVVLWMGESVGVAGVAPNANYTGDGNDSIPLDLNGVTTTTMTGNIWLMLESTNIFWFSTNVGNALNCLGWEDNL